MLLKLLHKLSIDNPNLWITHLPSRAQSPDKRNFERLDPEKSWEKLRNIKPDTQYISAFES